MPDEIQHIPIKGKLTVRQIFLYTAFVVTACTFYFTILDKMNKGIVQSENNNTILTQMQQDDKKDKELNQLVIDQLKAQQHEISLRLGILEARFEAYKVERNDN